MQDQQGCKKKNIRAEEGQMTAARVKQHEDEEEDTGIRPKSGTGQYFSSSSPSSESSKKNNESLRLLQVNFRLRLKQLTCESKTQ